MKNATKLSAISFVFDGLILEITASVADYKLKIINKKALVLRIDMM
jgi:hypothetical protein